MLAGPRHAADTALHVGPPGVGTTTLVKELAALVNAPLRRMSFNGELRVADFLGSKELIVDAKTGQTVTEFRLGVLPDAAERGHWILLDEFDSCPPPVGFVLHPFLERPRHLLVSGRRDEIAIHKNTRVIATANTLGYGDDTGLYSGTGPLNEALLDRFGVVIRLGYPEKDAEATMLNNRTGLSIELAKAMVEVATLVREAQSNQTTTVSISPRRLIDWASKTVRLGKDRISVAASVTLTNKLPPDDAKFIESTVQRVIGSK
jgi:cobaltochelatase CobS